MMHLLLDIYRQNVYYYQQHIGPLWIDTRKNTQRNFAVSSRCRLHAQYNHCSRNDPSLEVSYECHDCFVSRSSSRGQTFYQSSSTCTHRSKASLRITCKLAGDESIINPCDITNVLKSMSAGRTIPTLHLRQKPLLVPANGGTTLFKLLLRDQPKMIASILIFLFFSFWQLLHLVFVQEFS